MKVYKGKNKIGSNLISIETDSTKIIIDSGISWSQCSDTVCKTIDADNFDAIFILPYYTDHMALAYNTYKKVPIYINQYSYNMIRAANGFRNKETRVATSFLIDKQVICIGNIKITPYATLSKDEYILHIESSNKKVLYIRNITQRSGQDFSNLPTDIDILICENKLFDEGNLRYKFTARNEKHLCCQATNLIKKVRGPIFVLLSSMNIDKINSFYHIAKKTKRLFLQELYTAEITSKMGVSVANPKDYDGIKVFATRVYGDYRYSLYNVYDECKRISKRDIVNKQFIMCVRPSMYNYIESLCKTINCSEGIMFCCLSSGYSNQQDIQSFLEKCENLGLELISLNMGNCINTKATKRLIKYTVPKKILLSHIHSVSWFKEQRLKWKMCYKVQHIKPL